MSFNLLENSMWKTTLQFLSTCLDIAFVFDYTWWDEPGWMPGASPATLSVLSMCRGEKTQQKTQRVKRENLGLSHGQSCMSLSHTSPSHGLQFSMNCCSRGFFPQSAALQEQLAPL